MTRNATLVISHQWKSTLTFPIRSSGPPISPSQAMRCYFR